MAIPTFDHIDEVGQYFVKAIHARGLFVHLYAAVENSVTELVVRAADDARFSKLGKPPYVWEGKLKRFAKIIAVEGGFRQQGDRIRHLLKTFTGIEQHRHHLIHGLMSFVDDAQPGLITFHYHHIAGGEVLARVWKVSVEDLTEMADALASFTAEFVAAISSAMKDANIAPVPLSELAEYTPEERKL